MFFLDKGFFKRIKTGCPALEDLLLHDCIIMDDEISFSKTLQILTSHEAVPPGLQGFYFYSLVLPVLKGHEISSNTVTASVVLDGSPNYDIHASDFCHYSWSLSGVKHLEFDYLAGKVYN
uniref:Uncharacterized protein n=1 Tax=Oryza rufipogon TaxID=4529 RepID=A0A0E0QWL5_ORYRU